ncbi:lysylphosphatidylglycerol synthase transmembrane domain-containing protein [Actinokineospora sp. NPDC004072]
MTVTTPRVVVAVCSTIGAVVLLVVALPAVAGTDWAAIGRVLGMVSAPAAVGLVAVWLAGLWSYTYVLTGSLPGLGNAQALVLNLAGSAVSNVLPLGGAAGVAVTFALTRSWGHARGPVVVSTLVTGLWNILSRLVLGVVGVGALLAAGPTSNWVGLATAVVPLLAVVVAVAVLGRRRVLDAVVAGVGRVLPRRWRRSLPEMVGRFRQDAGRVVAAGWRRMSAGMAAATALQGVLFAACLAATGVRPGAALLIAAFALSRVLTAVAVTPNGFGITEPATVGLLIAYGAPPAETAAAVVLFTFFTYLVEIPLGAVGFLVWALLRRWREQAPGADRVRGG